MMQFRRSGQRDDRRRRVLTDAMSASTRPPRRAWSGQVATVASQPRHKSVNYGDAVFMDQEPRLTDLVPLWLPVFLIPLTVGLAIIAGLEALYAWMPQFASMTTDGRIAAFDLDGEGSLAVWFSSMTLAAAGLVAILVFLVRRHKVDDYHGYYRIWLWAAMCWFLMSLDETASLHEGFKEAMVLFAGTRLFGDGSIWWVVPYFFLLGAVGTRLLVDMRDCWLSSAALLLSAVSYFVGIFVQMGWLMPDSGARGVMVEEGAEMLGDLLLFLAMGLHARHVILDAKGLLVRQDALRVRQKGILRPVCDDPVELPQQRATGTEVGGIDDQEYEDSQSESDAAVEGVENVTVHPPHGVPRPVMSSFRQSPRRNAAAVGSGTKTTTTQQSTAPAEPAANPQVSRKLTKQERKALRRRLEKMRRQRERQAEEL
jgi:hypothetical protein